MRVMQGTKAIYDIGRRKNMETKQVRDRLNFDGKEEEYDRYLWRLGCVFAHLGCGTNGEWENELLALSHGYADLGVV
jgi:hypothetical protein